jgi:hypothetical protein
MRNRRTLMLGLLATVLLGGSAVWAATQHWTAVCSCGWVAPATTSYVAAQYMGDRHVNTHRGAGVHVYGVIPLD